ncbi:MAG: PorP/SprF family type IX secretion system membrane protein [Sphingomonadales bacterium]
MKNVVIIIVTCLVCQWSAAQTDPHFSQFYAYPLGLNPGLAGVNGGDFRVSAVYRTQWAQVMTPFTTMGISADVATQKNINFGINLLNQTAGNAGYQYQHGYLTIGYGGVRFGEDDNQQISFGIQVGALARKFDPSGFQFGDQWNSITGYDPAVSSADLLPRTSSSDLDMGAGVSYSDARENRPLRLFGGFSAFHLNRPQDPFVTRSVSQQIPMRFSVHGGVQISLNERIQLTPQFLVTKQGTAMEQMLGMSIRMPAASNADLLAGINYRINDALAPYLGVGYGQWLFGFSYDVAAGELGKQVPGTSSFELSLTYTGLPSGRPIRYLSCPRL